MQQEAEAMSALFDGYKHAYGTFEQKGNRERDNKVTGQVRSIKADVTTQLWVNHLTGVQSLGLIPIDENGEVRFGCIDVDEYTGSPTVLLTKLDEFRLPIVPTRSKSGGLHLWLFTNEKVKAATMQSKLRELAAAIGYGKSEIFPKQVEVLYSRGDIGNWINMPYFNGLDGGRYGIRPDGKSMSLEEFIQTARIKRVSLKELEDLKVNLKKDFEDGPPCLQHLTTQGFPAGTRNSGLYNLGVYAKKAFPDTWEKIVEEYNHKYLHPPLAANEVKELQKSLKKKDYQYQCSQPPISAHCNAAKCRGRRFGVGAHAGMPGISGLTKYDSRPPVWFVDVDGGGRLELGTEDLQMQDRFQRKCMEQLNSMPPKMNVAAWQELIQNLLENVVVIDAPVEATPQGQLLYHLDKFLTGKVRGSHLEHLILGKPFHDEANHVYCFRLNDFLDYLERQKFKEFTAAKITSVFKNTLKAKHAFNNIKGKGVNYWIVDDGHFTTQTESFGVPDEFTDKGPY